MKRKGLPSELARMLRLLADGIETYPGTADEFLDNLERRILMLNAKKLRPGEPPIPGITTDERDGRWMRFKR